MRLCSTASNFKLTKLAMLQSSAVGLRMASNLSEALCGNFKKVSVANTKMASLAAVVNHNV